MANQALNLASRAISSVGVADPASVLLGANGQPLRLTEAQRTQSLLGAYDSFNAVAFQFAPFNPDVFIAAKGYDVLDDMLNIAAVRKPLDILRESLLSKGWSVVPQMDGKPADKGAPDYATAAKMADEFTHVLMNIEDDAGNVTDFRQTLWEMAYAVHMGFNVTAIQWVLMKYGPLKGKYGLAQLAPKPCKQIGFDLDLSTLAVKNLTSYTPLTGYKFGIPIETALRYTHAPRANLPYGMGKGRAAYKHSWSLDNLYKFWLVGLEIFGAPFLLGTAPPGKTLELARAAIAQIRQGAPAVLPTGVDVQLMEIAGTGLASFAAAVQYHKEECAFAYLGNSLTTTVGENGGNRALGQVQQGTQDGGAAMVRGDLENVITNQLMRRWVRYCYGQDALRFCPRLSLGDWDSVDVQQMAGAMQTLTTMGAVHESEPIVRQRVGLPPPDPVHKAALDSRNQTKDQAAQIANQTALDPPAKNDKSPDDDKPTTTQEK